MTEVLTFLDALPVLSILTGSFPLRWCPSFVRMEQRGLRVSIVLCCGLQYPRRCTFVSCLPLILAGHLVPHARDDSASCGAPRVFLTLLVW